MRVILAAILFLISFALQLRMILVFRRMMRDVNGILPENSRVPEIGPGWLRGGVIRLHRRFFPASTSRKQLYTLWCLMMVTFLSALACIVTFSVSTQRGHIR